MDVLTPTFHFKNEPKALAYIYIYIYYREVRDPPSNMIQFTKVVGWGGRKQRGKQTDLDYYRKLTFYSLRKRKTTIRKKRKH